MKLSGSAKISNEGEKILTGSTMYLFVQPSGLDIGYLARQGLGSGRTTIQKE